MVRYIIDRNNRVIEIMSPVNNVTALEALVNIYPGYKFKIS